MSHEEERNWGAEPWRAPKLDDGDTPIFSECGRIIKAGQYGHGSNGIDYRSHWFMVVSSSHWCYLLVRHGGGQERIQLDYSVARASQFFLPLDSNQRYLLMHMLFSLYKDTKRTAEDSAALKFKTAFATGRLKKRKQRGTSSVRVWIDNTDNAANTITIGGSQ